MSHASLTAEMMLQGTRGTIDPIRSAGQSNGPKKKKEKTLRDITNKLDIRLVSLKPGMSGL